MENSVSYKKVKSVLVIQKHITSPVKHQRWSFLQKQLPLTIFAKASILDFWQGSKYASANTFDVESFYKNDQRSQLFCQKQSYCCTYRIKHSYWYFLNLFWPSSLDIEIFLEICDFTLKNNRHFYPVPGASF